MTKEHADTLSAILMWAYEHHIQVMFCRRYDYSDGEGYPILRFSNNGKHIEQAFWPISRIDDEAKHIWQEVGRKLLIEPPRFL